MKAILVNVKDRSVNPIELDGSLEAIYKAIDCRCFAVATYLDNGDAVYADDEGLFGNPQYFSEIGEYPEPIAGNLLIVGSTHDGDSTDCVSTVEEIKNDIIFMDLADVVNRYR